MSVGPPAAYGTSRRTALLGYASADCRVGAGAAVADNSASDTAAPAAKPTRLLKYGMFFVIVLLTRDHSTGSGARRNAAKPLISSSSRAVQSVRSAPVAGIPDFLYLLVAEGGLAHTHSRGVRLQHEMQIEDAIIKHIIIVITAAATLACVAPSLNAAQNDPAANYPNKPIRFIVPFSPGAGTDITARTIAQKLTEKWGQQVIADNRTGAGGAIGVDFAAKAIPDGYTICLISASNSVNSATNSGLPYDLVKDLQGITQATSLFYVVYIHPSVPAKSVRELIDYAKANPGKLNFGSSGSNTLQHFAGELFNHMANVKNVHIPYKGTASVIPAMLSGEIQLGFGSLIGTRMQMQQGRLRGIAITAAKRSPSIDLPTVAESGVPGYEVDQWYGAITSAKVPQPIVKKLNAAMVEALRQPETAARLAADGSIPAATSPEQFNAHISSEIAKWKRLVKEANLRIER